MQNAKAPKCPHCEVLAKPLDEDGFYYVCGICGTEFISQEAHARTLLQTLNPPGARDAIVAEMDQSPHVPGWKQVLSLIGIPVEEESYETGIKPWVGGAFILICFAVYLNGDAALDAFKLDPKQPGRLAGATFLTYAFAHSGLMHLLSNVFFVWPFLDNVEEHLGHLRTFLLIVLSAIAAGFVQVRIDGSPLPLVGASGVCFAFATLYCLLFPSHRFLIAVPMMGIFAWNKRLRLRAPVFFLLYFVTELFGLFSQANGLTNVSHLGHLGGACAGFIAYRLWRNSPALIE